MDEDQGSLLRSDILENLGRCHYDGSASMISQYFLDLLLFSIIGQTRKLESAVSFS